METLVIATRSSPLAMWQAHHVAEILEKAGFTLELRPIETVGDKKLEVSLSKIGDKGVFTQELEGMLLRGEAHLAVHSAKDMPSRLPEGLQIIAFTERENPWDVLVSHHPDAQLETVKKIGTSSTRRVALLKRYFPHIETVTIRGNLQTRFRKMEEGACDAMILAYAGVNRMHLGQTIRQALPLDVFTPAVGQGALAIEVSDNLETSVKEKIASLLNHTTTSHCLAAERSFLRTMDGGCSVPVFAYARFQENSFVLSGGIVSLDGKEEIRLTKTQEGLLSGNDYIQIGKNMAEEILGMGGDAILSKIKQNLQP